MKIEKKLRLLSIFAIVSVIFVTTSVNAVTKNQDISKMLKYQQNGEYSCVDGMEDTCQEITDITSVEKGDFMEIAVENNGGIITKKWFRVLTQTSEKITLVGVDNVYETGASGVLLPGNYNDLKNRVTNSPASQYNYRLVKEDELISAGCSYDTNDSCPSYLYNVSTANSSIGCDFFISDSFNSSKIVAISKAEGRMRLIGNAENLNDEVQIDNVTQKLCAKTVIEINKYGDSSTYSDADGKGSVQGDNDSTKADTVNVGDTLKIAYIGYIIGFLVLIIGAYIIYKSVKDSEVSIEE